MLGWPSLAEGQPISDGQAADPAIVVTAKRYGEAKVASERELDEENIADYGAKSVGDLLTEISPLIDGTGTQPELLVNGQRVNDPKSIASFPPEALQRIEVLPEQAAGQLGIAPDKRVVNLVLKKSFSSISGAGGFSAPLRGGYDTEQLSAQYFSVRGEKTLNASVTVGRSSDLRETERTVSASPGLASTGGNVAAAEGGEVDPVFSALAGLAATSAAVPSKADAGILSLEDFVAGANVPYPRDDADYRTLVPRAQNVDATLSIGRPVGSGSLYLSLNTSRQMSTRLLGLAEANILLPSSSPFPPFSAEVTLSRLLAGEVLTGTQASTSVGITANYGIELGKQSLTLFSSYSRQEATTVTQRGYDLAEAQAAISAGDAQHNPFGPLPLGALQSERVHSVGESWSASSEMHGPLPLRLPAGPANWSLNNSYSRSVSRTAKDDESFQVARTRTDSSVTLGLPLTSREEFLPALGNLGLSFNGNLSFATGQGWRARYGAGFYWTPIEALSLNGRMSIEGIALDQSQAAAPLVETPDVRVYDYSTGELAEVTIVSGGNPGLLRGSSRSLTASLSIKPWSWEGPSLNFNYQRREARNGVGPLPALTPAVEAAFPERVTRDASGRLTRIDQRTINFPQELSETLISRFNWTIPLGPIEPPPGTATDLAPGGQEARAASRRWAKAPRGGRRKARLMLSLSHTWQLTNRLRIRDAAPELDRLSGDGGGQSRHSLQADARLAGAGSNIAVSAAWKNAYITRSGSGGSGDLRFGALLTVQLGMNLDLGRIGLFGKPKWLNNTAFGLDFTNLLDRHQRVTRADGSTPPGYLPDEIDPNGRMLTVSVRRRF